MLSLFLFLCFIEAGSRVIHFAYDSIVQPPARPALSFLIKDPYLQFRIRPNYPSETPDAENRLINSRGFRGEDFVRDTEKKLIVCMGDSGTFGIGTDKGYPEQLQKTLVSRGKKYQVVNAGVPGHVSLQTLIYYAKELIYLKPDIIIIYMGWNDIVVSNNEKWESGYVLQLEGENCSYLMNGSSNKSILEDILYKSVFVRGLRRILCVFLQKNTANKNAGIIIGGNEVFLNRALDDYEQNIKNIIRMAEAEDTEIYLCTLISQADLFNSYKEKIFNEMDADKKAYYKDFISPNEIKINDRIRKIAADTHVNLIDIQDHLSKELTPDDFFDYYHLLDSGYEKFVACASEKIDVLTFSEE